MHRLKVEGILGVHPRRKKRAQLIKYRDIVGEFIQSDYLKKGLAFYSENCSAYKIFGIEELYKYILLLYTNPYGIDRHLLLNKKNDLEKDVYYSSDQWIDWINKQKKLKTPNNPNDPLDVLLVHEISIGQKLLNKKVELSNKLAAVFSAKLTLHSLSEDFFKSKKITKAITGKTNYQKIINEGYTEMIDQLNKITVITKKGGIPEKVFSFGNTHAIEINAKVLGVDFDPTVDVIIKGPDGKNIKEFTTDLIKHNKLNGNKATVAGGAHVLEVGDNVENISKYEYVRNKINKNGAKRFNQKAYNALNSRGFTVFLAGLEVINFYYATLGLYESIRKEESILVRAKEVINTAGIGAELVEASFRVQKAHYIAIGKELAKDVANKLSNKIVIAGAIGGIITAGMCITDAVIAFNKRDVDASIAWGLAGVAFTVSTAAGIWGGTVFLLSGPVGWIALGIGLIGVVSANIFIDTDLEFYFKHFLLSDHKKLPIGNNSPMAYNRLVYKSIETLVESEDEDIKNSLMYPEDAIASLHDLTVCTSINYYVENMKMKFAGRRGRSTGYYVSSFGITMNFNHFLYDVNQLEVKGMIVRHTWVNSIGSNAEEFNLILKDAKIVSLKNGQQQLLVIVAIPYEKRKLIKDDKDLEMVLAIRVRINKEKNHYFPYRLLDKPERYIGAKFKLYKNIYTNSGENNTDNQNLVFDTLANLKLDKTW